MVYYTILGISDKYASMLENIFLLQIHNYQDQKLLGNKIFLNVIKQISNLQTSGIVINVNSQEKQVFFTLAYIVGDNLGLNTILGFTKSFNSRNCCRICYEDSKIFKKRVKEDISVFKQK